MAPSTKLAFSFLASASLIASVASAQLVTEGGQKFSVILSGANECTSLGVCGIGDLNASGTADITVNPGQRRICWEITTTGVHAQYSIIGAHIHAAPAGSNAPPLIDLSAEENSTAENCTSTFTPGGAPLTRSLIDQIRRSPENYYINVHWIDTDPAAPALPSFAPGAIRGQLSKGRLK